MSASPRASDGVRPGRRAWAPRWLVVTHRYVGVVMGLLMLLWFVSGVVMLFARWPEVTAEQRTAGLAPIPWAACCKLPPALGPQLVDAVAVEGLAGRPVARVDDEVWDLASGRPVHHVTEMEAWSVAATFAAHTGLKGRPAAIRQVERDQWTVTGYFDKGRPYWKVRLGDAGATDLYVSAKTGVVAQKTDVKSRFTAWLGPIPHWLYPTVLRQNPKLWNAVVVWTSLIGTFLTVTGLYLGLVAWRPLAARITPFRGLMAWHHLFGLFAGVLTLMWVASGLVSMNPWGFLEGGPDDSRARIRGELTFDQVAPAILAAQGPSVRRIEAVPLGGAVFVMADGRRLDAAGRPAPISQAELAQAGRAAGAVAHQEMIRAEDAYYHAGHEGAVPLPAWRVVLTDGTRLYLDAATGQPHVRFDADARAYRWLFEGLHRLDVVPGFDRGPGWMAVVIALLLAAGGGVATGVWLGWRRIKADVAALTRTKA